MDAVEVAAVDEAALGVVDATAALVLEVAGLTCPSFGSASNFATVGDDASESALLKLCEAVRDTGSVLWLAFPVAGASGPVNIMVCR